MLTLSWNWYLGSG